MGYGLMGFVIFLAFSHQMLPPNIVVDDTMALGLWALKGVCKDIKSNGSQMKYLNW